MRLEQLVFLGLGTRGDDRALFHWIGSMFNPKSLKYLQNSLKKHARRNLKRMIGTCSNYTCLVANDLPCASHKIERCNLSSFLRMSKNKEVPVEETVLRRLGGAKFIVNYPISQCFATKAVCFRRHWEFSTVNWFDV